ncbi:hypothetical protein ACHAQH_002316 [Verticillium albo-atrum]
MASIESLPSDIIYSIFDQVDDMASMSAFTESHPRVKEICMLREDAVYAAVIRNQIGPDNFPDALLADLCPVLTTQAELAPLRLDALIASCTARGFSISGKKHALRLSRMHAKVTAFADLLIATCNLKVFPFLKADLHAEPVTETERDRFRRALYRIEFLSKLFGRSIHPVDTIPVGRKLVELNQWLNSVFTPWELSQVKFVNHILSQHLQISIQEALPKDAAWRLHRARVDCPAIWDKASDVPSSARTVRIPSKKTIIFFSNSSVGFDDAPTVLANGGLECSIVIGGNKPSS